MDTGNFFDFDTALQPDDDYDRCLEEGGDEYNVLNDETFGSAAIGGDWESNHEKFSSLTKVEKCMKQNRADTKPILNKDDFLPENYQLKFLGESLASLNVRKPQNYLSNPTQLYGSQKSSAFLDGNKPSLPGESIWSSRPNQPTASRLVHIPSTNPNQVPMLSKSFPPPPGMTQFSLDGRVKTVADLEYELRANQLMSQPPPSKTMSSLSDMDSQFAKRFFYRSNPSLPFSNMGPAQTTNNLPGFRGNPHNLSNLNRNIQLSMQHNMAHKPNFGYQNSFNNAPGNGPSWPPYSIGPLGSYNQKFLHQRQDEHNYHQNGSNFNRPYFNFPNERRQFDHNPHYNPSSSPHGMYDRMYHKEGSPGSQNRMSIDAEWDEWHRIRLHDPYAGLMTPREKSWLRNIQSLQLSTDNPYQDDYYYMMMKLKKQKKRDEEVIEVDGLQFLSDKNKDGKEYEPPTMENSLGKLQVLSVHAPRKIIDLQVIHLDPACTTTPLQREMRKHRHLLLHLEKLCNIHIELDDLERKIRGLPDCPTRDAYKSKCSQLVTKLWTGISSSSSTFVQILCIKKGKTLISRFVKWLGKVELSHLFIVLFQNLSTFARKDSQDNCLSLLWGAIDRFIFSAESEQILELGVKLTSQLVPQKNQIIPPLECQIGLSIVLALLVRGEQFYSFLEPKDAWQEFLSKVIIGVIIASSKSKEAFVKLVLLSVSLAIHSKAITTHVRRCTKLDATTRQHAIEVLQLVESHLQKSSPSSNATHPSTP